MQYKCAVLYLKPCIGSLLSGSFAEYRILPDLTTCSLPSYYIWLFAVPWILCYFLPPSFWTCSFACSHTILALPLTNSSFSFHLPFLPGQAHSELYSHDNLSISSTRWAVCWGPEDRSYILFFSELLVCLTHTSHSANIAEKQMNDWTR